jgi:Flp pilus assembly secretin CpaC
MGRLTRTAVLAAALLSFGAAAAAASRLDVEINQSRRIGLRGAAANVVVGDPTIADVTMLDAHSVIVTGKGYGSTQVMVMDRAGRMLLDSHVAVRAPDDGRLTLYRGVAASEFSCSPRCEAVGGKAGAPAAAAAAPAP